MRLRRSDRKCFTQRVSSGMDFIEFISALYLIEGQLLLEWGKFVELIGFLIENNFCLILR